MVQYDPSKVHRCCDKTQNLPDTDLQAADDCGGGN